MIDTPHALRDLLQIADRLSYLTSQVDYLQRQERFLLEEVRRLQTMAELSDYNRIMGKYNKND